MMHWLHAEVELKPPRYGWQQAACAPLHMLSLQVSRCVAGLHAEVQAGLAAQARQSLSSR